MLPPPHVLEPSQVLPPLQVLPVQVTAQVLAQVLAHVLAQVLAQVLAHVLAHVLAQVLAQVLPQVLPHVLAQVLAQVLPAEVGVHATYWGACSRGRSSNGWGLGVTGGGISCGSSRPMDDRSEDRYMGEVAESSTSVPLRRSLCSLEACATPSAPAARTVSPRGVWAIACAPQPCSLCSPQACPASLPQAGALGWGARAGGVAAAAATGASGVQVAEAEVVAGSGLGRGTRACVPVGSSFS